jgi:hypothetical protein
MRLALWALCRCRQPVVEVFGDALCCGRVEVGQHGDHVAGLGVDLQVAVDAWCAASVADPAVAVGVAGVFEAVGVSGAGPGLTFPVIRSFVVWG